MKASEIVEQLTQLIEKHGDREVLTNWDGDTMNIPDNPKLFDAGWVLPDEIDDDSPFALNLPDYGNFSDRDK